jgi:hypothetical protein
VDKYDGSFRQILSTGITAALRSFMDFTGMQDLMPPLKTEQAMDATT